MKVLVVDDQHLARDAVAYTLTAAGYEVETAADGREALVILAKGGCQLVVSDWKMPGMDGIELCRAIREGNFRGYTFFIMLSSNSRVEDTVEGLMAGADDYVSKPFNPAELVLRVNTGRRIVGLETRDMAIFAMAKLAESRDPETGAHLERVRSYCRCLALQIKSHPKYAGQVDDHYIQLIYETSPLHDIGKVAIPDSVLLKPGRLTSDEFEIMKSHTIRGAETLQAALDEYPLAKFLQMARDIALSHHEKYDGSGYPYGLAGERIPLCGRIVAVADVYDALTSKRVYKDAFSHEVAKSIIVESSGTHFDPVIVDAFVQREAEFLGICRRYGDSAPVRPVATTITAPSPVVHHPAGALMGTAGAIN